MMGTGSLHGVQTTFLLLLVMVASFAAMARRLRVPYPILLVIAGLGISFVPHVPRFPLDPQLVFLIFLPPLLYASAWQTSWREFRRNLVSIALLALGLVGFTVWGVAEVADRFITALDWKSGFILGAVVATMDAIAASSIASAVGLPRQVVDVLEGESLVNDATGLLALEFGLTMLLRGETPTPLQGTLRLLWLMGGGLGVGLLVGVITAWFERWIDDGPVELVISLIVPYAAYLAGEGIRASGVLAVVACGLYMSWKSVALFSPEVRLQLLSAWSGLNFMLNGMVFVLIGLQLPYVLAGIRGEYSRWTLLEYGAVFSAVLIALRLLWIFPGAEMAYQIRTRLLGQRYDRPPARAVFVVGWTGMRGVVALAAAISLPEVLGSGRPFAQRDLIVFLTFCVILVTLVVQGLSLPALIRWLGLAGSGEDRGAERKARQTVLQAAVSYLEQSQERDGEAFAHEYEDLLHFYRDRLQAITASADGGADERTPATEEQRRRIGVGAVQAERRELIRMRDGGEIGDELLREMERELDLTEARQRTR